MEMGRRAMVNNIQVLRCLAALIVVWHHLQTQLHLQMGMPLLGFHGRAGVDIFFVISGFIMFHTTRHGGRSVYRFWTDRALRIAPLYWLATMAVAVLVVMGLHPAGVMKISAEDIVADLLFLPDIRADGDFYPIIDVGWTLIFEMYFYGLFGLTFFLRSQVAALAALSAYFVMTWMILRLAPDLPYPMQFYFRPITLEFVAGGVLALLYHQPLSPGRWAGAVGWGLVGAGVVALAVAGQLLGHRMNEDFALRMIAFGGPAVALVGGALLLERAGVVARSRFVLLLGAASYAIYLCHQLVVEVVVWVVNKAAPAGSVVELTIAAACAFTLAVVVGVILHKRVELPLTARLKQAVPDRVFRSA